MRRTAGLERQTAAATGHSCARMLFMREESLPCTSSWRLQIIGGICLYVVVVVACIPELFRKPGMLRDNSICVVFMFLGSFVLHPICRSLLAGSASCHRFARMISVW